MGFFSDLLGKSSANAATQLGQRNAAQLQSSYGQSNDYAKQGYEAATGRMQPFYEQGQRGYTAYNNAMGINGDAARQGQFDSFSSSPFLAYARQNSAYDTNRLFGKYNAQGMGNSGASQLAVSRAAGERAQGDVSQYLQMLAQMGQQGAGFAGQMAGLDQNYYGTLGNNAVGLGTALVSNDTNATMAANNARMSGANNLLGMVGGAAQIAMGMPPSMMGRGGSAPSGYPQSGVSYTPARPGTLPWN